MHTWCIHMYLLQSIGIVAIVLKISFFFIRVLFITENKRNLSKQRESLNFLSKIVKERLRKHVFRKV